MFGGVCGNSRMDATGVAGWLRRWGPALGWMGVIAVFSEARWDAAATRSLLLPLLATLFPWAGPAALEGVHFALRKLGHLIEYGVLALLWVRALEPGRPPRRARALALALALLYALLDETHQGWTGARTASPWDVALDGAGAGLAVGSLAGGACAERWLRRAARAVTAAIAAGALLGAVLDWSLGLPALDLVVAALLAAAGFVVLRPAPERGRRPPSEGHGSVQIENHR